MPSTRIKPATFRSLARRSNQPSYAIPDLVCNQISKSSSNPDADKILLLRKRLMLNTKCLGVAFFYFFESHVEAFRLRVMPKLDHLSVLFQELLVEGSRCTDVAS